MDCIHVRLVYVRLGLVPGRHPKIKLFDLLYCVICCEAETKYGISNDQACELGRNKYFKKQERYSG